MIPFIILAAGRGTRAGRVSRSLHKALLPLGDRAILSHIIDLAPLDAEFVIVTGHRADQIREYVALAHPGMQVRWVHIEDYAADDSGPGTSLLRALDDAYGDGSFYFTSCDTLWQRDMTLWNDRDHSWSAVAPMPSGTNPASWCRMQTDADGRVTCVLDKTNRRRDVTLTYTGMSFIASHHRMSFVEGIKSASLTAGERQITGGLQHIPLQTRRINWADVGDANAYQRTVAQFTGYDFTKIGEATYVLPERGRVVKYWDDAEIKRDRFLRGMRLGTSVPTMLYEDVHMLAYEFVPGVTAYEAAEVDSDLVLRLLDWAHKELWRPAAGINTRDVCWRFYHDKTLARIDLLSFPLRVQAQDALSHVNWDFVTRCQPYVIHGDFNLGNIIVPANDPSSFVTIDWRENFGGVLRWGDRRYDVGKLLAGMHVNWSRARVGDFSEWTRGHKLANDIRSSPLYGRDVELIAALSLLNSAPLHAPPLDEVLVARGCAWLESL